VTPVLAKPCPFRRGIAHVTVGWRRFAKWLSSGLRGRAIGFLKQMFWPPPPFDAPDQEAEFLVDYAERFVTHRRAAILLALLTWILYSTWDFFYALHGEEFRRSLVTIFVLRSLGAIYLAIVAVILVRPSVVNVRIQGAPVDDSLDEPTLDERQTTYLLSSCVCIVFLLHLLMTVTSAFPFDFAVYFPPLSVIMTFAFGLTRLRACVVLFLNGYCLATSSIILPFADAEGVLSSSYVVYSLSYLLAFAAVGCAVAVELERTARSAFLRERALADSERQTEHLRHLAEQRDLAKSKFLAEAAHDLRQPMQAFMNLLEAGRHALARDDVNGCSELLERAQDAARSARSSFTAVLDISRLESGFVKAEYTDFPIRELVDEVVSPLLALAADRGVKVRVRKHIGESVLVRSDRDLLGRVLGNLISNAVKYSDGKKGDRATVLVGVVRLSNCGRIDIVDNGIGIAKDQWDNVFKPFVQLGNPGRDREKGVGLGLSIVDAIVNLLTEHSLRMNSVPSRGTRFSLKVPRAEVAETEYLDQIPRTPAMSPVAGTYVLYVEDDVLVRNSTISIFEEHRILYEAFDSLDGMENQLRSLERLPDLLITDFRLPSGYSGEDVIRMVSRTLAATLPTIVITGEALSSEQQKSLGAAKILLKPVAPESLLAEITRCALSENRLRRGDHDPSPGYLDQELDSPRDLEKSK